MENIPTDADLMTWINNHWGVIFAAYFVLSNVVSFVPGDTTLGKILHALIGNAGYVVRKTFESKTGLTMPPPPPADGAEKK